MQQHELSFDRVTPASSGAHEAAHAQQHTIQQHHHEVPPSMLQQGHSHNASFASSSATTTAANHRVSFSDDSLAQSRNRRDSGENAHSASIRGQERLGAHQQHHHHQAMPADAPPPMTQTQAELSVSGQQQQNSSTRAPRVVLLNLLAYVLRHGYALLPSNRSDATNKGCSLLLQALDGTSELSAGESACGEMVTSGTLDCFLFTSPDNGVEALPDAVRDTARVFFGSTASQIALQHYAVHAMHYCRISNEGTIVALVLLARLIRKGIPFTQRSAHRMLLASIIVGAKSHDEVYYAMSLYARCGGVSLETARSLEIAFLDLLAYETHVTDAEFATMLFTVRSCHCQLSSRHFGTWAELMGAIALPVTTCGPNAAPVGRNDSPDTLRILQLNKAAASAPIVANDTTNHNHPSSGILLGGGEDQQHQDTTVHFNLDGPDCGPIQKASSVVIHQGAEMLQSTSPQAHHHNHFGQQHHQQQQQHGRYDSLSTMNGESMPTTPRGIPYSRRASHDDSRRESLSYGISSHGSLQSRGSATSIIPTPPQRKSIVQQ